MKRNYRETMIQQRKQRYRSAFRLIFFSAVVCLGVAHIKLMRGLEGAISQDADVALDENRGDRRLQQFENCSPVEEQPNKFAADKTTTTKKKPCALLFFGLAKEFRSIVLPSIQENILNVGENSKCDIYAHNYNISSLTHEKNGEFGNVIHPEEIFDLTDKVVMDTNEEFYAKRNMKYYLNTLFLPTRKVGWNENSLLNMYKQWHSIERAWKLMQETEKKLNIEYERVGLFRSDVKYDTPIDIFDGDAVIPKFGFLVNDRMFYGLYENANVWANVRYPSVACYQPRHRALGMHSEFFMNDFVLKNIPNVTKKDICFNRVRANGMVLEDDCTKVYEFPRFLIDLDLTKSTI